MSETVPHVMTNAVTGEQLVIQLKPKGGHSAVEAQAFLEERLKEAERIDPQNCEIGRWYANAVDVYGIFEEHEEFACYVVGVGLSFHALDQRLGDMLREMPIPDPAAVRHVANKTLVGIPINCIPGPAT
jgi:hypothetical protein